MEELIHSLSNRRYKKKMKGDNKIIIFGVVALLVIVVVIFGGIYYNGAQQQTALEEQNRIELAKIEAQKAGQVVAPSEVGKIGLFKVNTYNRQADNANTLVAITSGLYVWDLITGAFIADGVTTSTSARTSVSGTQGKTYKSLAYTTGSYYGDIKEKPLGEFTDLDLDVHASCNTILVKSYDTSLANGKNLTGIGANGEGYFEKFKIKNNNTNCAYNFAGLYFDTIVTSNISKITVEEGKHPFYNKATDGNPIAIERVKELDDFVWMVDADSVKTGYQPVFLQEYDEFDTGNVVVKADGDGCVGNLDEVDVYSFDKASVRSNVIGGTILENVVEDDAVTPADVGEGDVFMESIATAGAGNSGSFWCKSASSG